MEDDQNERRAKWKTTKIKAQLPRVTAFIYDEARTDA